MRKFTREEIEAAREATVWDFGNGVLYDMCRAHPGHTREDVIIGKIWIIGRSYAAAIERRRNGQTFGDGFYELHVAPAMKAAGIDSWLQSLGDMAQAGGPETILAHKRLTDLFAKVSGLEKRSLASKYLHFHKPAHFYLYDGRARNAITKVVPRLTRIPDIDAGENDLEYKDFVRRCVWLRRSIEEEHGLTLSPREIDKALLTIAAEDGAKEEPAGTGVSL